MPALPALAVAMIRVVVKVMRMGFMSRVLLLCGKGLIQMCRVELLLQGLCQSPQAPEVIYVTKREKIF